MIFLYYGQFEHYGYCENWIADALDRNGHHCVRVRRTKWFDESLVLRIARDNNATHLLLSKTPEILPSQLQFLQVSGLQIVFWTFDWMRHPEAWEWYKPLAQVANVCFQTDGHDTDGFYAKEGIHRVELHQGIVPGLHDLPRSRDFWSTGEMVSLGGDLTFIGSGYSERRHALLRLLEPVTDTASFKKYGEPDRQVWGHEFAAAVYFSKIVIGDNFTNDVPGYWSDRVYLTLACGGFFLTAYVPGLELEFTNHKDLVWWKSFEELAELIAHYLPREAERRAIALNGHNLVQSRDTYDQRVAHMTEVLKSL